MFLNTLAICLLVIARPALASEYNLATPVRSTPWYGWLTLETPHFYIHFPPGEEQIARQLAAAAEEAHRFIVPRLEHLPTEKTHVVLADTTDIANANASVTPYNLITVNPVPPGAGSFLDGIMPVTGSTWLKSVLRHEYSHVIHLDLHDGITTQIRQIFGRLPGAGLPNIYLGAAITEGYAVHQEAAGGQGRANSPIYQMYLQAAASKEEAPFWDRVLGNYPITDYEPGPPSYLYGYSLINYIARIYGEDKLALALNRYTERPLDGINVAFSYALDQPFTKIWQDWWQALQTDYQLVDAVMPASMHLLKQVGQVALWPTWSPDGRYIAYGSTGGVVSALRLRLAPDQETNLAERDRRLVNGLISTSGRFAWHPDSRQIVYARLEYDNENRLFSDIYAYDIIKNVEIRLTRGYRAYSPTLSPDGRYLAYVSRQGQESRVLVQTYPQGEPRVLWWPKDGISICLENIVALAWSPKGDSLAITAAMPDGGMGLFLLPITRLGSMWLTDKLQVLASGDYLYMDPAWSQDGSLLFFSSNYLGPMAIHVVDIQKREFYQVSQALFGAFNPAVSPDGTNLLITAYDTDGYHLATLPIEPNNWRRWLANNEQVASTPQNEAFSLEVIRLTPKEIAEAAQTPTTTIMGTRIAGRTPAAWERDLMQDVNPGDYVIRPYNVRESMAPRYWVPLWGGPDGNWLTGISTSNSDALGRHYYKLDLSITRSAAACAVEYKWRPTPLGGRWELQVGITGARRLSISEVKGELHLNWLHRQVMNEALVTISAIASKSGTQQNKTSIGLDANWSIADGDGRLQVQTYTAIGLWQDFGAVLSSSGYYHWQKEWRMPDTWQVQTSTAVQASTQEQAYIISVRGLGPRKLTGQLATQATFQAERVLLNINRGWDDKPFYLQNMALAFFTDAGAAGDKGKCRQTALSAGVEVLIRGSIVYGAVDTTLRMGVARLLDGSQPYRLHVGANLTY